MTIEKIKELKLQLEAAEKEMKVAYEKDQKVQAELWKNIISDPESYDWHITLPYEMQENRIFNLTLNTNTMQNYIRSVINEWKNNEGNIPRKYIRLLK